MASQPITWSFNNSGVGPLKVPGYGLSVDIVMRDSDSFCHGANDFIGDRLTVRELAMLRFMDTVTDKPDWHVKVFDDEIVQKWKKEVSEAQKLMRSDATFEWCITELKDRAQAFEKEGFARTYETASCCAKSDGDRVISKQMRDELMKEVVPLMNVPDEQKDWHPGSNNQVLNLIHPSMYPLVYGKSTFLPTGLVGLENALSYTGQGETVPGKLEPLEKSTQPATGALLGPQSDSHRLWSDRFQWLPCEVKFTGPVGSTDVKIASYINNLDPTKHMPLYHVIEKFISKSIPLWNAVLVKGDGHASVRIRTYGVETGDEEEPDFGGEYGENEEDFDIDALRAYVNGPDNPDYEPGFEDDELPENWEEDPEYTVEGMAAQWKFRRIRTIIHPEPGDSFTYEQWKKGDTENAVMLATGWGSSLKTGPALDSYTVKLQEQYRDRGLQVIVKMSGIELTPDKPSYQGGSWHLEGMNNEHIIGTAIYYYDVENVTESRLSIRQEAELDGMSLNYMQSDHGPLSTVFGTNGMYDEPAVQVLGSISTPKNRLLVFPNTLQHKPESFELIDKTKPGHRRFLVLWLVDPYYRIFSTANIPPQQRAWVEEAAEKFERKLEELPQELNDMVAKFASEGTMTKEEAEEYRLELMKERTSFGETVEKNFEHYNLCEH
jgi:hypothetical protein